jgi:hypothetical protein
MGGGDACIAPLAFVSEEERSCNIEEKASIIIKAWLNAAVLAAAKEGEGMTFDIKVHLVFNSC